MKRRITGANPYMPLWEHVPDGEPRVFTYAGETRVYVYGSHDTEITEYCGRDQVVWSAPVDDLTNWTCHGVCYTATNGSILYAPDVVKKGDTYYLYAAEDKGSHVYVATSSNPAGPFTNPVLTELGFDPGVLVDDDGKAYAFWGFCSSYCGELNDDMATIKEGTLREHPLLHCRSTFNDDREFEDLETGFFEASSPRKINGKYVYIFSLMHNKPIKELGSPENCNGFLSYFYSDNPLDGYVWGGDISFNGGEIVNIMGVDYMTYQWGNNHGSLCEINGKWYIFYHRQTGVNEFSRQAMLEPVKVDMDSEGHLYIGKIIYKEIDGRKVPVASVPVEMTSQGPMTNGIDAYSIISAGYACHIFKFGTVYAPCSTCNAYIKPVYEKDYNISAPVVNIQSETTVGFRYLQFGDNNKNPQKVNIKLETLEDIHINIRYGGFDGMIAGSKDVEKGTENVTIQLTQALNGKLPIYFEFLSDKDGEIVRFVEFDFDRV